MRWIKDFHHYMYNNNKNNIYYNTYKLFRILFFFLIANNI